MQYLLFLTSTVAGSAASGLIIVIVLIICCKVLLKSAHRHQRGGIVYGFMLHIHFGITLSISPFSLLPAVIRRVDKAQTNKDATNPRELNATYILGRYPKV